MRDFRDHHPVIRDDLVKVRNYIVQGLSSREALIRESVDGLTEANGKMLRPAFVMLAARATRESLQLEQAGPGRTGPGRAAARGRLVRIPDRLYRMAAALEILHMATLVHDDVIDGASTRRGRQSLNARFGDRHAVLVGDFLFSRCFNLVADHASIKNARFLARGIVQICGSEIAQSRRFDPASLSLRHYLRRIMGKTAMLFMLCFHAGAAQAGAGADLVGLLTRIGYNVGMSFQITDDLLDFHGQPGLTGKPAGQDLREGIYTLPVVLAARRDAALMLPLLTREALTAPAGCERAITAVESLDGFGQARSLAGGCTGRALREAGRLPAVPSAGLLVELIGRLLDRSA